MLAVGLQEQRNVFREMLAIRIDRDRVGETRFPCVPEPLSERMSFARIPVQDNQTGLLLQRIEPRQRIVGTSVQDDKDIFTTSLRPLDNVNDRPGIVERRDNDTYTSVFQAYLTVIRHMSDIFATGVSPFRKSIWALTWPSLCIILRTSA